MAIKNRLREILKQANMTQKELATNVGMSKQAISNIVNNQYSTSLDQAFKISKYVGMAIEDVFSYEEDSQ